MSNSPINTALCAFGMSGKVFHAPFVSVHNGFNLYGVFERSKKNAQEFYPGLKSFDSLSEMLADENIELVIVNTPNATHYEFTKKALLAGKHVIVEKPFTIHSSEGIELAALAKEQNRKISVYHNRRWDSDFTLVKNVIKERLLGEIVEAEIHFDRFKEELSPKAHKEIPAPGTGVLFDLGSHLIDQALQLFGNPSAVFADITNLRPISQVDDYFEVLLYYPGKRVRLKSSYQVREAIPSFVIHGSKGSLLKTRADVQENDLIAGMKPHGENWGIEPDNEKGLIHTEKNGEIIKEYISAPHGNYMEYFNGVFSAIRSNQSMPVTAEEGVDVIKIIEAAFLSNQEKRIIELR